MSRHEHSQSAWRAPSSLCRKPYRSAGAGTLIRTRLLAQSCPANQTRISDEQTMRHNPSFLAPQTPEEVAMRQYFTPQELVDHFTLLPHEHDLLANKSGVNRLGFVVLFKYFQWEGRFPA